MTRIIYILKSIFLSIESIIFIIPMVLWYFNIEFIFNKISILFFETIDIDHVIFQFAIPITMISLSYAQLNNLLQPETDLKSFYNWGDYIKLKDTFIAGLIWNFVCIIVTISILLYKEDLSSRLIGALYVSSCLSSIYSTISLIFAKQRIKEILELNKKNE